MTTFSSRGTGSRCPSIARCYHRADSPELAPAAPWPPRPRGRRGCREARAPGKTHTAPGAPRTSWALADRAALSTIIARTQHPVKADRPHTRARGPAWMYCPASDQARNAGARQRRRERGGRRTHVPGRLARHGRRWWTQRPSSVLSAAPLALTPAKNPRGGTAGFKAGPAYRATFYSSCSWDASWDERQWVKMAK